eukprot:m51a1_g4219 hypothetical protein (259) ;mRNA; r:86754-87724
MACAAVDAVVEGCVYVARGDVTNVYILIDPREGLTVIDPGLPCDARVILEGIRSVAASAAAAGAPTYLSRILVTHADRDHIGSLVAVKRAYPAAEVVSSAIESRGIELGHLPGREPKAREEDSPPTGCLLHFPPDPKARQQWDEFILSTPPVVVEGLPGGATQTVKDGDAIPVLPGGLRVVGTAGHTEGHVSYYAAGVAGGTLFTGDACWVSNDGSQVARLPNCFNWDQQMAEQSERVLLALGAGTVCAAHGPVWRKH